MFFCCGGPSWRHKGYGFAIYYEGATFVDELVASAIAVEQRDTAGTPVDDGAVDARRAMPYDETGLYFHRGKDDRAPTIGLDRAGENAIAHRCRLPGRFVVAVDPT